MDASSFNRIGIVFNILAGFLMAPEIIGIEQIQSRFKKYRSNSSDQPGWWKKYSEIKNSLDQGLIYFSQKLPFKEGLATNIKTSIYGDINRRLNIAQLIGVILLTPPLLFLALFICSLVMWGYITVVSQAALFFSVSADSETIMIIIWLMAFIASGFCAVCSILAESRLRKAYLKVTGKDPNLSLKNKNDQIFQMVRELSLTLIKSKKIKNKVAGFLIRSIYWFLVTIYLLALPPLLLLVVPMLILYVPIVLPVLVFKLFEWYFLSLKNKNGFRFFVVSTGVFLFIVGNILQLVAA